MTDILDDVQGALRGGSGENTVVLLHRCESEIKRLRVICQDVIELTQTSPKLIQNPTVDTCLDVTQEIYDVASDYYPSPEPTEGK